MVSGNPKTWTPFWLISYSYPSYPFRIVMLMSWNVHPLQKPRGCWKFWSPSNLTYQIRFVQKKADALNRGSRTPIRFFSAALHRCSPEPGHSYTWTFTWVGANNKMGDFIESRWKMSKLSLMKSNDLWEVFGCRGKTSQAQWWKKWALRSHSPIFLALSISKSTAAEISWPAHQAS